MGMFESGRGAAPVCFLCTPDASPGDAVLVHRGFVVEALDPGRAVDALILRAELAEALSPGPVSVPRPAG